MAFSSEELKLAAVIVVAIIGGNAGSMLNAVDPNVRADAFTRTDSIRLTEHIEREMERERKLLRSSILAEISERRAVEDKECTKYRQSIYDRLNEIENNQKYYLRMIKQQDKAQK